ncbi:hypothetical protein K2173_017474 [Erythroxylum novogranatense]|uniref:SAM domain-containing protein n=1 Tax=Erythroxylum novogranatense TaxID=1862640 RepID=A0AAV8TNA6_9ROSI|nr:hypothetical protein K2173_017474 [Erythroxylum novogranatense]
MAPNRSSYQLQHDGEDDFPVPLSQIPKSFTSTPLRPTKRSRRSQPDLSPESAFEENCSLDFIESTLDYTYKPVNDARLEEYVENEEALPGNGGYFCNSIEARLLKSRTANARDVGLDLGDGFGDFEECELDTLIKLCADDENREESVICADARDCSVQCPVCEIDISDLNEESRLVHTNDCLDKEEIHAEDQVVLEGRGSESQFSPLVVGRPVHSLPKEVEVSPVIKWLRSLGLQKYEEAFDREEIDWDTLMWLTEEDLLGMGVTALGPRKKIVQALSELRKGSNLVVEAHRDLQIPGEFQSRSTHVAEVHVDASEVTEDETSKSSTNKLITDYFPGSFNVRAKVCSTSRLHGGKENCDPHSSRKRATKVPVRTGKHKNIPLWCSIPGTTFRVDAFKYLRGDCSHWFLSHFHMDHYQGLTKSFRHGKIYCSLITAKLVNMKIGIPWEKLHVLPLNQRIDIAGVGVTCLDANHCPGAIVILFEPPNGKAVLHTGDFRFCETKASIPALQTCPIHTLILDTTYCNPQYDFPKQEAVIQFVIEAIQAESFNPKTLFLIGSYTIGKERLFLEVARVLRRKVYVTASKFRLLECLGFSNEDMQWFTLNEQESHIHVVPMWTLASFKRLKHLSNQYVGRFSLIVAFSPTGWTFGKGKKKSPGRKWQQGTIIRYEVPYSEHSSFSELKEFVKLISPQNIIPSVNNYGPDSADAMVSLLQS